METNPTHTHTPTTETSTTTIPGTRTCSPDPLIASPPHRPDRQEEQILVSDVGDGDERNMDPPGDEDVTMSVKNRIAAFNHKIETSVVPGVANANKAPVRSESSASGFKSVDGMICKSPAVQPKVCLSSDNRPHVNPDAGVSTPVPPSGRQPHQKPVIDAHRLTPPHSSRPRNRKNSAPDLRPSGHVLHPIIHNNNNKVLNPLISELKERLQQRDGIHSQSSEAETDSVVDGETPASSRRGKSHQNHVRIIIQRDSSPSSDDDDATTCQSHQNTISSTSSTGTTRSTSVTSMNTLDGATVVPEGVDDKSRKLYLIAHELTTTEQSFVKILKLLNVDFRREVAEKHLPRDVSIVILKHLDELTRVSCELLKELECKLSQWPEKRKISDVIVKIGPFLSVYSFYMRDFQAINNAFEEAVKKYTQFASTLKEFESNTEKCKKLTVQHYLLKPIQRIPQYRLLLTDYLKNMPEDHPDHADTVTALDIVCRCADHANNMIKRGDSFAKLLNLQNSLIRPQEIIKPERVFIREGELMKVSRKYFQPRIFVLCSDALLYLSQVQVGSFQLHHELPLTGMRVTLQQEEENHEFIINSPTRSLILRAKSEKDRQVWYTDLTKAIEENASRRRTFINNNKIRTESVLGEEYPVWVPDERVTMCQVCTTPFTLTYRRHHCRACGKVVCIVCSSSRVPLKYLNNRKSRVCDQCRDELHRQMMVRKEKRKSTISLTTDSDDSGSQPVVPAESPDSDIDISDGDFSRDHNLVGFLRKSMQRKKPIPNSRKVPAGQKDSRMRGNLTFRKKNSWKKYYFVIHEDGVLYSYKASEDVVALESIPLLGWTVSPCNEPLDGFDADQLFQINHTGQPTLVFKSDSPELKERSVLHRLPLSHEPNVSCHKDRWMKAMREASVLN